MLDAILNFIDTTGFMALINSMKDAVANGENFLMVIGTPLMIIIACVLLYLAIVKQYEPLLLLEPASENLRVSGSLHMHPSIFISMH